MRPLRGGVRKALLLGSPPGNTEEGTMKQHKQINNSRPKPEQRQRSLALLRKLSVYVKRNIDFKPEQMEPINLTSEAVHPDLEEEKLFLI